MNGSKNKVALLVHSCDRYSFLYQGFESFFQRYWDFSIPCNYYFATEEKEAEVKGFVNIRSGKGQWSDRLATLIKMIPEDYILYFQEDMWLTKKVNPEFFVQLFETALPQKWKQVKLHSSEVYKTIPTEEFIQGFRLTTLDNVASDFLMSHQVTLWDKKFLLAQMHKDEHPWRNERKATKRLKKLNETIYHLDYFAENGKPAINDNRNPVGRSEYKTVSVNGTVGGDVLQFIEVLKQGSKEEQGYATKLQHHFDNQLTHDGRPKPRKEDIFKKIKNLIRGK